MVGASPLTATPGGSTRRTVFAASTKHRQQCILETLEFLGNLADSLPEPHQRLTDRTSNTIPAVIEQLHSILNIEITRSDHNSLSSVSTKDSWRSSSNSGTSWSTDLTETSEQDLHLSSELSQSRPSLPSDWRAKIDSHATSTPSAASKACFICSVCGQIFEYMPDDPKSQGSQSKNLRQHRERWESPGWYIGEVQQALKQCGIKSRPETPADFLRVILDAATELPQVKRCALAELIKDNQILKELAQDRGVDVKAISEELWRSSTGASGPSTIFKRIILHGLDHQQRGYELRDPPPKQRRSVKRPFTGARDSLITTQRRQTANQWDSSSGPSQEGHLMFPMDIDTPSNHNPGPSTTIASSGADILPGANWSDLAPADHQPMYMPQGQSDADQGFANPDMYGH